MLRRLTILLLTLYALITAYSALRLSVGLPNPPFFTPVLTLIAFTFALLHAGQRLGWRLALLLLALCFTVSLLFESVGVATGLVYGKYHYSDLLGFKFLGLVPLIIPAAWFMMMYPSYIIISRLIPTGWKTWQWRLGVAALGGIVMTAWDMAMDPLMVSGGHWVWDQPGAYFGVPVQNYWGWWLTTFVTFALFGWLAHTRPEKGGLIKHSFDWQANASYAITGMSTVIVSMNLGLAGSGLAGFFAMLPWAISSWW
jgi:uncharacterized membrane protein